MCLPNANSAEVAAASMAVVVDSQVNGRARLKENLEDKSGDEENNEHAVSLI